MHYNTLRVIKWAVVHLRLIFCTRWSKAKLPIDQYNFNVIWKSKVGAQLHFIDISIKAPLHPFGWQYQGIANICWCIVNIIPCNERKILSDRYGWPFLIVSFLFCFRIGTLRAKGGHSSSVLNKIYTDIRSWQTEIVQLSKRQRLFQQTSHNLYEKTCPYQT